MPWWKKLIYPFAYVAVMVLVLIFRFLAWLRVEGVLHNWEEIPYRWEIVGVQKGKVFVRDLDENKLLEGGK